MPFAIPPRQLRLEAGNVGQLDSERERLETQVSAINAEHLQDEQRVMMRRLECIYTYI